MMAVVIKGFEKVKKNMNVTVKNLDKDSDSFIFTLATMIEARIVKNIRAGGVPFIPLAPSTLEEKARLGFLLTPLVRTGEMMGSVRSRRTNDREAVVEVKSGYAVSHEFGVASENLPARPFVRPAVTETEASFKTDTEKIGIELRVS